MKLEIPNKWRQIPLEQLLEFVTGGDWGKDESYDDDDFALAYCIRGSEIKNWEDDKGKTASLRKIKKSSIESRKLKEGDILVEISGGGPEQPVGRTVLIDKAALSFEPSTPKICTNFLRLIRPIKEIDSKFLNLYLKLFYYSGDIVHYQGGSNNLRNLKFPDFIKIVVPVPPIEQQKNIVSKIEELLMDLESGKQQLEAAQQQLKIYRQSLLKWAFQGKLTNKNINGELPKRWKSVTIEDVANVSTGVTPLRSNKSFWENGSIPWITSGALNDSFVNQSKEFISKKAFEETTLKLLPKHTLLIALYGEGKTRGKCSELLFESTTNQAIAGIILKDDFKESKNFLKWFLFKNYNDIRRLSAGGVQPNLNLSIIKKTKFPFPPLKEQQLIIDELKSKLTVCDKIEEAISNSLQQAEILHQSILKKAYEGKLVPSVADKRAKVIPFYKPRNEYFYQMQLLGLIAKASKQNKVAHGEMTLAKYAYLTDKIYNIPTFYDYKRWHLGPFPPAMKKAINNKQYFKKSSEGIEVLNEKTLFKSNNPYQQQVQQAVNELTTIFSKYTGKDRPHKTELLATVCKVIEDIQNTDLKAVRNSMKEWKIELKGEKHKTKAQKFSESETEKCLQFVKEKGWDKKLLK